MQQIKLEPQDEEIPEGLAAPRSIEPPDGFTPEEWEALTEVFTTFYYHSSC